MNSRLPIFILLFASFTVSTKSFLFSTTHLLHSISRKRSCHSSSCQISLLHPLPDFVTTSIIEPRTRASSVSSSSSEFSSTMTSLSPSILASIDKINDIITTDAGGRGMTALVVPGDLLASAQIFARLKHKSGSDAAHVVVLSGFPCCVTQSPPTETDGPPGALALALAALGLGYRVTVVTDECNEDVFRAAADSLLVSLEKKGGYDSKMLKLVAFPDDSKMSSKNDDNLKALAISADLIVACERAGPAADGKCYTMRGIDMNEKGLIAPLHKIVDHARKENVLFLAIGDGGNEMGMGKVIDKIHEHIPQGEKIGAVTVADHLVAASVSNWGGYALAAAAALVRADDGKDEREKWVERCVPTESEEVELLKRCVEKGCRDGVSGKMEATVDGMPLETSMKCLRDIRDAALTR